MREFEQPELATALRELAIERDASFAKRRQTYVDYDAEGRIERITWPRELGPQPATADVRRRCNGSPETRGCCQAVMIGFEIKRMFFDRQAVISKVDAATRRVLSSSGPSCGGSARAASASAKAAPAATQFARGC